MTNQVDIGVLRGLLERGTKGLWEFWNSNSVRRIWSTGNGQRGRFVAHGSAYQGVEDIAMTDADGKLIVAAVNALPALLDELERLRELLDRATETMIQARGALAGAADERGHGVTPSAAIQAIDEELIAANLAIKQGMMEQLRDRQVVTHPLHPDPWVDAVARFEAGTAKIAAEGDQAGVDGGAE